MEYDELDIIKTSDFTLASTLLTMGHDVIGIDKTNPKRVIFYFRKTSDLEVHLDQYWKNIVKVNPKDFVFNQRELRARIHTDE